MFQDHIDHILRYFSLMHSTPHLVNFLAQEIVLAQIQGMNKFLKMQNQVIAEVLKKYPVKHQYL